MAIPKSLYDQTREAEERVYITDPANRLNRRKVSFPYTPTISISGDAGYSSYDPTHSNYQQKIFQSGTNAEISLIAPMIIRTELDAEEVLDMSQFFRAAMKMHFGEKDESKGLPPPVLRLHINNIYTNVPVVVAGFQWNFENDVDYIPFDNNGTVAYLPVSSTFVLSLSTTYAPAKVRGEFSLRDYSMGNLRNKGYI